MVVLRIIFRFKESFSRLSGSCLSWQSRNVSFSYRSSKTLIVRCIIDFVGKAVKQPAAFTQKESEFTVKDKNGKIHECPPSRELLGRHSWTLVFPFISYHLVAFDCCVLSWQSDRRGQEVRKRVYWEFCTSVSLQSVCSAFGEEFKEVSPKVWMEDGFEYSVNSRKEFMIYLCTLHNIVNRTLLKPVYPCNIELLEERWRTGCPECWSSDSSRKMTSEESME